MGRYLVIGAATWIEAKKEEAMKKYSSMEKFKEALTKRFNAHGIYAMEEDEEKICLTLRDDVAREEWLPFLQAFYALRYGPANGYWPEIEKQLSGHDNLKEWCDIAKYNNKYYYHYDSLRWYPIDGEKEWGATTVSVSFVGFSLDGKIGMEFYYEVFAFFTRLIRERLSQFRLADSLLVHITE